MTAKTTWRKRPLGGKAAKQRRPSPAKPQSRPRRKRAGRRLSFPWVSTIALLAVAGIAAFWLVSNRSPKGGEARGAAPAFTLMSTSGTPVSLSDYRGRNVLLYFNEGVGCDACFYQMVELQKHVGDLAGAGLTVVPIVVNPAPQVASEMARFGITTPYLVDEGARVSEAYGMLGKGMHAGLPGHGFVLVDGAGRVRWKMEYPSMYVSTADLLAALRPALA